MIFRFTNSRRQAVAGEIKIRVAKKKKSKR